MAFKLPSLKGRVNSDISLVSHGLPLFDCIQLQDKEEAIGCGFFGLVFVARGNGEKVITYLCSTTSQILHITYRIYISFIYLYLQFRLLGFGVIFCGSVF